GTLTEGRLGVVASAWEGVAAQTGLAALAALEQGSEHGIGAALVAHAAASGVAAAPVTAFRSLPGRGVSGRVAGAEWRAGSPAWLGGGALPAPLADQLAAHEQHGRTCVLVSRDGTAVGLLALQDRLRADAGAVTAALRADGVAVTLLSGDRQTAARAVATALGDLEVIAEVLPEDKAAVVAGFQARGERVAMVGDGINDAPALAQADVGIALGAGTDVSVDCADVVLAGERLALVDAARDLARATLRTVRQNIALSIAYNSLMVPLAMAGLVTPLLAAVTMPLSSLAVIGNAARLRRWQPPARSVSAGEGAAAQPEELLHWK
ncbi:MAG TPA: HAD-IC family P-type ATPase, partial [Gammaproteobacteria bacterium]